jgi:hypothetical protein
MQLSRGLDVEKSAHLDFRKAVPEPQKIRCSPLTQNCM